MTRLQALDAVAEAARVLAHRAEHGMSLLTARCKVQATLAALPAQPAGETVKVQARVSRSESGNSMRVYGMTIDGGETWSFDSGPHIAIITANVPLPTTPTIPASVTLEVTP